MTSAWLGLMYALIIAAGMSLMTRVHTFPKRHTEALVNDVGFHTANAARRLLTDTTQLQKVLLCLKLHLESNLVR